ncbi:MAG: hypothetical protein Q9184_000612 [Pyrenodesmia sp. 2 TL-2023]
MDRPAKRRKVVPVVQVPSKTEADSTGGGPQIQYPPRGNRDAFDQHLIRGAISGIPRAAVPSARKSSPPVSIHGKPKTQRLHPRNFISHRAADEVVNPVVQPVETAVASFINVVLDRGGSSVGNVLVPAESTIFNVGGYGPITINNNAPAMATPSARQPNAESSAASRPYRNSDAAQQTPQPASTPDRQAEATAAASQNAPVQQTPLSIEVLGSSSQVILSPPPTPLPLSPSNSSSAATSSDSYFDSTSDTTSATQISTVPSTITSQSATTSELPPISNGGFGPTRGNFNTSAVTATQTSSGLTTLPIIVTSSSNSTTVFSTSFSTFLTTSGSSTSNSTLSSSTSATGTSSSSTTSLLASSTTSSSPSSASVSSTGQGSGVAGGFGGPTGTTGGPSSSSTTAAAGSGVGATAPTPTIVGSVVGSVAGLALILILLLFFLRRRKRQGQQRTISPPVPQSASTGPGADTGTMTERSSAAVPLAGAGAAFFRRLRPGSGATATTTDTTPSERGFQNLGGRRLESVLSSQGDGFGNVPFGAAAAAASAPGPSSGRGQPPPAIPIVTSAPGAPGHSSPESLDGSSFYRDSQGFYGGPGQPLQSAEPASNSSPTFVAPASPPQSPTHPPLGTSPEGVAVMRPGPARTPVTTQPGLSPIRGSPRQQQRGTPPPPHIPDTIQERTRDGLGRSHPSLDGSRSSRFAENI